MSKREEMMALDEIYKEVPAYIPSEEELEEQYKFFKNIMKEDEVSLDLDFCPE